MFHGADCVVDFGAELCGVACWHGCVCVVSVHGGKSEIFSVSDCGGNVCKGLGVFHVLVPVLLVVLLGTLITLMVGCLVVKLLGDIFLFVLVVGVFGGCGWRVLVGVVFVPL